MVVAATAAALMEAVSAVVDFMVAASAVAISTAEVSARFMAAIDMVASIVATATALSAMVAIALRIADISTGGTTVTTGRITIGAAGSFGPIMVRTASVGVAIGAIGKL
jgi:hypothetical protein